MNTEEARQYFKPLTYQDITPIDITELRYILEKHICKRNEIEENKYKQTGQRDYVYKLCPFKKNQEVYENGHVKYVYLEVLCDNFSRREAISFNRDGFIGFAGWASTYNTDLFVDAFIQWVDITKRKKQPMPTWSDLFDENHHLRFLNKEYESKIKELTLEKLMLEKQVENLLSIKAKQLGDMSGLN